MNQGVYLYSVMLTMEFHAFFVNSSSGVAFTTTSVALLVQYRHMHLADFLVLYAVQVASGKPFGSEDYMALTPEWSVYGAAEGGFDPQETRVKKERRHGTADSGGCT